MKICPVKHICKILNLNQVQLANQVCVSVGTVNRWASKIDTIPPQILRTFYLLEENYILKLKVQKIDMLFTLLKEISNEKLL